ncbi:MBL fold metallo-hydrolase [Ideonella sp.]|uniref:MBL fold metallo-hydrolase n=1 Tax=Ideonella sp. TaxID=1929293 RepID=UPI003BB589BD
MVLPHEHELHYPLADQLPARGGTIEVAPGVRWLRMGLPFALDHINLWLLRDVSAEGEVGWAVVDCGLGDEATQQAWLTLFKQGLDGLPVLRVIVTHMHPDHIGLADWLCEQWGCPLWISQTEWATAHLARSVTPTTDGASAGSAGGEQAAAFFARHGLLDMAALDKIRSRRNDYAEMVPALPGQFHRLMNGMVLRIGEHDWHCISGHGHTPEHIALACPALGLLISGDMVLPRISTNISVLDIEPEGDPLPLYLRSLDQFAGLPESTLVLPSHGKPFVGLAVRIRQMREHHDARLAEVLAACTDTACSAADLLPMMFRRTLDLQQIPFAMGEAVAHLHALQGRGLLQARRGDDGVLRFQVPAAGSAG